MLLPYTLSTKFIDLLLWLTLLMESRRWFHSNIDGKEAERLLLENGVEGSFLVRPSTAFHGDVAISIRRGNNVIHIRILNDGDTYDLGSGEKFATLSELIEHYWKNKNQLREQNGELLTLRHPLPCADPTSGRWFHGFISRAQAEEELLNKGKSGSFLVRESSTKHGNYVLSVRIDENKVTHVCINRQNGVFDVGVAEKFDKLSDLIDHYAKNPMVEANGTVVTLKQPLNSTRISAPSIKDRIAELSKSSPSGPSKNVGSATGFEEEFGALQQLESKNHERREGRKLANRDKNRYKNVLPFDSTRVVLNDADKTIDGDDYINANYIQNSDVLEGAERHGNKTYIATQGCLSTTVSAFWRMVWQENSCIIVNTTKEFERGKGKCYKYWPSKARPIETHGPLTVQLIEEVVNEDFILRIMELTLTDDNDAAITNGDNSKAASNYSVTHHSVAALTPVDTNVSSNIQQRHRHGRITSGNSVDKPVVGLDDAVFPETITTRCVTPVSRSSLTQHSVKNHYIVSENNANGNANSDSNSARITFAATSPIPPVKIGSINLLNNGVTPAKSLLSSSSRYIYQYNFQQWPDHGVPEDPGRVLSFLDIINEQQEKLSEQASGPLVVHCSAGIGRTGTFIVVDVLLNQIKALGPNCEIDVYKTVQFVREQRSGMVQTEAQYRFIYHAVQKFIETERHLRLSRLTDKPYLNLAKNAAADAAAAAASAAACASGGANNIMPTNGSSDQGDSTPINATSSVAAATAVG